MSHVRANVGLRKRGGSSRGFTLVEVSSVLAISLLLAGAAVPNLMAAIQGLRLSSTTTAAAGLIREMRLRAVSDDRHYSLQAASIGDATVIFADLNANGSLDTGEPVVQAAGTITPASTGFPDLSSMSLDFTPQPAGAQVSVNERGVPCVIQGASCRTIWNGSTVGFVYVLSGTTTKSASWSAVVLSPSGRVSSWSWNGTLWRQR